MILGREVVMLIVVCVAISAPLMAIVAEEGTAEDTDSISKQIEGIFAKADELSKWRKQRVREYLSSLTDEELAQVYSNAGGGKGLSLDVALEAVQKDRKQVVNWLPRALNEEDQVAYQKKYEGLVDELAALGTKAVPILASRTGYDYMRRGHYGMAREALCRIGRTDIAPIIALMDSDNGFVRANAAYALSRLVDPHAKDALLKALDDTYGPVHACALTGLIELGPAVVGDSTLVTCLIDGLQDWTCIDESIQGLERYGDEAAIEALEVIERFWPGRGKQDYRYRARHAINAIQRRAGKAVKEVRREDYSTEILRDELLSAVEHPNAAIRWMAVRMAVEYMGSHGRDCSKINEIVDLLIERIKQENDPDVLLRIATNLRWLMTLSGESSKSIVSEENVQKAFDAFLSVLNTHLMFANNILNERELEASIQDPFKAERVELLEMAIRGAGIVLDAAHKHEMRLEGIERFKVILRMWISSSKDPKLRFAAYQPVATLANISPKTGKGWSPQEREELLKELAPMLDSPVPNWLLIECLGFLGDERLVPRMIELLRHDDPLVRRYAAQALGHIGDLRALPALEHLAKTDPVEYEKGVLHVRKAAAEAVGKIRGKQALKEPTEQESAVKDIGKEQQSLVVFPKDDTTMNLRWVPGEPDDISAVQNIDLLLIRRGYTYEVDTKNLISGQMANKSYVWAVYPSLERGNQQPFPVELTVRTEQPVTPHNNDNASVKEEQGERRLHWTASEQRVPPHFGYFGLETQEKVPDVEIRRECIPLSDGRARIKITVRGYVPLLIRVWGLKGRFGVEPESIEPRKHRLSKNGVLFFDYAKNSEGLGNESEYSFVVSGLQDGQLFYPMTNALHHVQMYSQGCPSTPMKQVHSSAWGFDFSLQSERCFRIARLARWVNELYQLESFTIPPAQSRARKSRAREKERSIQQKVVEIRANTENRHHLDKYAYREDRRDDGTHVLGTIHNAVVWESSKSPYVMDENVFVADDGSLTIEPGVKVKVVRLTEDTPSINAYIGLQISGTLTAQGTPDTMIKFTSASDKPNKYREWQGIVFNDGCSPSVLKWVLVEDAIFGVDAYGPALIAHCIFRECHTGIYLERDFVGEVLHNVSAYNAGSGIQCKGTRAEATIVNNICYENGDGIRGWWDAVAFADYNLYWSSKRNAGTRYYSGMEPGAHDITVNPCFVSPHENDFRLSSHSPARGAGYRNADVGLDIRHWSEEAGEQENANWFSDGARSLWHQGLDLERRDRPSVEGLYRQALKRDSAPELRDKVFCSLARVLISKAEYSLARQILHTVLYDSEYRHIRDLARRYLASAWALDSRPDEALAIVQEVEWPQSQAWAKPLVAKYRSMTGNPEGALRSLADLKSNEPYRYLKALSDMVSDHLSVGQVDAAVHVMKGFDDYPLAEEVPAAYLKIAKAARDQQRLDLAVELLHKSCRLDPFSKEAPESLTLLAEILDRDMKRHEEANAVLARLCAGYFPFNRYVVEATKTVHVETPLPTKMILLDASLGESSVFDRGPTGSNNFGQYEVMRILAEAGYTVHTNDRRQSAVRIRNVLTREIVNRYGLIILNGRYGGRAEPPIPREVIDTLVEYVGDGGSLLVVAGGKRLG
ncbi:MAG: HEAT repeat domain-containing protein, partial [Planctomycetota bacterium]